MAECAWLQQEEDGSWLRIREHDEARLDAALARGDQRVAICGGRVVATLFLTPDGQAAPTQKSARPQDWTGVLNSVYYDSPPLPLTRSTWCFKSWPNGSWTPFGSADDANLESMWSMSSSTDSSRVGKGSGLVTLDGRYRILVKRKSDGTVVLEMQPTDGQMSAWLEGRVRWSVERGWAGDEMPRLPQEEARNAQSCVAYEAMEPHALVLLVHGIGEMLWSRSRGQGPLGFVKSVREACDKLRSLAALSQARLEPSQRRRIEFLPVEWREGAASAETSHSLSLVTPPSVPLLRQFANEVILDVLLYEQASHRHRIRHRVLDRINVITSTWARFHPTFERDGGCIILVGHSLGSLICFDILSGSQYAKDTPPERQPIAPTQADRACTSQEIVSAGSGEVPNDASDNKSVGVASDICGDVPDDNHSTASGVSENEQHLSRSCADSVGLKCRPYACVALGSPVGCFIALRGEMLGPTFTLPGCTRYYNIYHRSDPVAYRIEPLLRDPQSEANKILPPAYVPFAGDKGGERFHVKLRRRVEGVKIAASAVSHWFGELGDSTAAAIEGAIKGSSGNTAAAPSESPPSESNRASGWALSDGERIDWMLQETELEVANEYLSALQAHTACALILRRALLHLVDVFAPHSPFDHVSRLIPCPNAADFENADVVHFICDCIIPSSGRSQKGEPPGVISTSVVSKDDEQASSSSLPAEA